MDFNDMKDNKKLVIIILSVIVLAVLFCYFRFRSDRQVDVFKPEDGLINQVEEEKIEEKQNEEEIVIHVTGEVNSPGIVKLSEGERIADAIEKAGGATENADLSKLNLAYVLEDGVKLRIPKKDEAGVLEEYVSEGSGEEILEELGKEAEGSTSGREAVVNINKASQEELMSLPGIGESTAQKILAYRKENGNFKVIEDIQNVSGIGESKFNQIKERIKVK